MFIPYNTDAPLYHWPYATVTLIVLNVFSFVIGTASVVAEWNRHDPFAEGAEMDEEDARLLREALEKMKKEHPPEDDEADEMDDFDHGQAARPRRSFASGMPLLFAQADAAEAEAAAAEEAMDDRVPVFFRRFGLTYANGLKPWQWFTSLFVHWGIWHIAGNMLFLWSFGLVVEGKLGWWKFLLVYFGIGGLSNFIQQAASFWFSYGFAFGASGAIFGLMAMCLVWAPMNEMSVVVWIAYRAILFDMTIWKLCLFYLVMNAVIAMLTLLTPSSELLHMMGAVIGFPLGILFLKLNWVDCEGWDMFRCMSNTQGKQELMGLKRPSYDKLKWSEEDAAGGADDEKTQKLRSKIRRLLKAGDLEAVIPEYEKLQEQNGQLEGEDLLKLADLLIADKQVAEAVPLMEEYLKRYDPQSPKVRLKLAKVYLVEQRPKAAAKVLKPLKPEELPPELAERRKQFLKKAKEMVDAGTVEFSE